MKRVATALRLVASIVGTAGIGLILGTLNPQSAQAAEPTNLAPTSIMVVTAVPYVPPTNDYQTYPAENQKVINKWNSLGRENGPLGQAMSYLSCQSGGWTCFEQFERGYIYTNSNQSTGNVVYYSSGKTGPLWAQSGYNNSPLGSATSDEICDGFGCYQSFQYGRIQFSAATGKTTSMLSNHPFYGYYQSKGFERGPLGYPKGEYTGVAGGNYQSFTGGDIYRTGNDTFSVTGEVFTKWKSTGGLTGSLGWPKTDYVCTTVGGPCNQQFLYGYINKIGTSAVTVRSVNFSRECQSLNNNSNKFFSPANPQNVKTPRISLAVAEGYGQYNATFFNCKLENNFYVTEWIAPATVGQSGFKRPGEFSGPTYLNYSPAGSFSVTEAFGLGNPGTKLAYQTLNPNSRWGGNPNTYNYNKYFEGMSSGYDENMWYFATRPQRDYAQGAVINYNRPPDSPIVQNAGFAIFLHGNRVPTAGCIALDDGPLVSWLQTATPGDRIIMGVRSDLFYP